MEYYTCADNSCVTRSLTTLAVVRNTATFDQVVFEIQHRGYFLYRTTALQKLCTFLP